VAKEKYYPLRKGYNDLLGYYEKRIDLKGSIAKKTKSSQFDTPRGEVSRIEASAPIHLRDQLSFDMF